MDPPASVPAHAAVATSVDAAAASVARNRSRNRQSRTSAHVSTNGTVISPEDSLPMPPSLAASRMTPTVSTASVPSYVKIAPTTGSSNSLRAETSNDLLSAVPPSLTQIMPTAQPQDKSAEYVLVFANAAVTQLHPLRDRSISRRLSVGGSILKNSTASSYMHSARSSPAKGPASGAVATLDSSKLSTVTEAPAKSLSIGQRASTVGTSTASTSNVRRSVAIQIPSASTVPGSNAFSASVTIQPQPPPQTTTQSHRLSISVNPRSLTNSNALPTPAPNHFYNMQQQMLNPNYRPTQPAVSDSPVSVYPSSSPLQMQQQQQILSSQVKMSITPPPQAASPQPNLKLPLSPETTVQYYRDLLTLYELHEVYQYPHVWFAGAMGIDKIGSARRKTGAVGAPPESLTKEDLTGIFNSGYDDSRGDYYVTSHDHIGYRYECISTLGKGSFGQAIKCYDHKTKSIVAVKIIRNKKRFEKQGMVEVKVLDRLRKEDADSTHNLVHMLDSFYFRGHLCIVFELLGINLYEWVKSGGFRGIHMGVLKVFSLQILECLQLLYKIKTVHCDMKPENILLCDSTFLQPQKCDIVPPSSTGLPRSFIDPDFNPRNPLYKIKVIDFGSACYEHEKIYTYVQSRFYRSPEVILGIPYTVAIDMWSFGCILAELLTGYPLFPGENEQEQLACIMELKGVPPEYIIQRGSRRKLFFEGYHPRSFTNSKGKKRKPGSRNISHLLRTTDVVFLDFIERCLDWDPDRRMKPDEALRHEWITGVPAPVPTPASAGSPVGGLSVVTTGTATPDRGRITSPKYSFGEIMSNAANSITGRRREASLSTHNTDKSRDARTKKVQSMAVPDSAAAAIGNSSGGEPSTWKATFSSWRGRIGSISGPATVSKKASENALKKENADQPLPAIPTATAPAMQRAASMRASQALVQAQTDLLQSPQGQAQNNRVSRAITDQQVNAGYAPPNQQTVVASATSTSNNAGFSDRYEQISQLQQQQILALHMKLEGADYIAPSVPSGQTYQPMPNLSSIRISEERGPAAEKSAVPSENVHIDVVGTSSGNARKSPSAASRKSSEGVGRSGSLSSKIGGLVRSMSKKRSK
ncbi:Dual specificity tyrosine-phosphorylation-regulated kinase [Entophlyctis sp. JEL0112]|nr:Dual specificity tyrosine-phosphorylation-regulated kinase [Entophlyctis sp. JEL0112]